MADDSGLMNDSLASSQRSAVGRATGFVDQRLCVVPRPIVRDALARPVTRRLVVTDAGYFPDASGHGRHRPRGADESIVILCVAGAGWVETVGGRGDVSPSTAVVIPAGTPHSYGAADTDPWTIWWCHVSGSDAAELVAEIGSVQLPVPVRGMDRHTIMIDEIISALEREQSPLTLLATAGIAWRMLTQLAVDGRLPPHDAPVQQAMRYLAERLGSHVPVPELAARFGVSASHLSTLFRIATGGGVLAYHTALKMGLARRLLDMTTLSIAEVGREIGMPDQFHFSRQFRKLHGVSPSVYRAQHKG